MSEGSDGDAATRSEFFQAYLQRLREVASELGHPPITETFNTRTEHNASTGIEHFGSWDETLVAAGLDPQEKPQPGPAKISKDEYLEAVRNLADELGYPPSSREMLQQGPYSHTTGVNLFGSWGAVIEAAGLEPTSEANQGARTPISDDEYLESVRDLASDLGRPPTSTEMQDQGAFSLGPAEDRWETWADVIEDAGLDPDKVPKDATATVSREIYVDALQQLADELGHPPTVEEMNEHGAYTSSPAYRFWDTWAQALDAAELDED